jgi:transaldolase/glucose-6-phosphate isomerase
MIDVDGIVGVTSNPTIFEKAISSGTDYDEQMRDVYGRGQDAGQVFFELMLKDIQDAADVFRGVYDKTNHLDGYISIEVTPDLARETQKSIEQARMFRERLQRPNILVKVPATAEGIPAIEQLIYEGININITLIFAIDRYREVIEAYIKGLERRLAEGKPVDDIWSVASFFVSRFDVKVDALLDARIAAAQTAEARATLTALKGQGAIANAKIAYEVFEQSITGARWARLAAHGAHVQRPLWASTSTKNPAYPDTLYVDALIGPQTVDTMPDATIAAFLDHGTVARTVDRNVDAAHRTIAALEEAGISMSEVMQALEDEGVAQFSASYDTVREAIVTKIAALGVQPASAITT